MDRKSHPIYDELVSMGIVDPGAVSPFYPSVRDRADVGVMRCATSGVILLDRVDHVGGSYYADMDGTSYWNANDRTAALRSTWEDDHRRAAQIRPFVSNRVYADIGCGLGGILDLMKPHARQVYGVEPQRGIREVLAGLGYAMHESIDGLVAQGVPVDVITLFHVFEHLSEPIASLRSLHRALTRGGQIVIEVPHARDALLTTYNLDAFKKFTFWSEHLVLHTRPSLEAYLRTAGFTNISVSGFQRYPLANHLHWLLRGEPGGQDKLTQLRSVALDDAYASALARIDQNDTIIAIATKA